MIHSIWVMAVIEEQSTKMGYVCSYWIMIVLLLWENCFSNMIPGIQFLELQQIRFSFGG